MMLLYFTAVTILLHAYLIIIQLLGTGILCFSVRGALDTRNDIIVIISVAYFPLFDWRPVGCHWLMRRV